MKDRLEALRSKLGVQWKELAEMLGISVPMIGCLRRGERNPSSKLELKISALENGCVALHDTQEPSETKTSNCPRCSQKDREISDLREELKDARAVIRDQASALAAALAAKPYPAAAPACGASCAVHKERRGA